MMAIWFDVDDLVAYFNAHRRPSGIQRLCFEIYREVWRLAGHTGQIKFCRHDLHYTKLIEIDWPTLHRTITEVTAKQHPDRDVLIKPLEEEPEPAPAPEPPPPPPPPPPRIHPHAPAWLRVITRLALPQKLRFAVGDAFYAANAQADAYRHAARAALTHFGLLRPKKPNIEPEVIDMPHGEAAMKPGDTLVALGSIWDPRFAPLLARLQAEYGIRFATIVYDLIPDFFPALTGEYLTALFRGWLYKVVPRADVLFTISHASAHDLRGVMRARGTPIQPPCVLPIGARRTKPKPRLRAPHLRPYVLFVSTIEPRKNHEFMLAVWEELLAALPPERVPDLIFAGRLMGNMAARFNARIGRETLRQRVRIITEPEDEQLAALYANCLFTVFPSFYEGWGLPVTESLCMGKTVAASNRASLPEAGGEFCVYYDPEDVPAAAAVIRELIENPKKISVLEKRIARHFHPPGWADTAGALLAALAPDAAMDRAA
jgi:glycosyltransferase involved in cell wall biosynthesis